MCVCVFSSPTGNVYACMCMCVPVCKFSVTGVGKRSHLSVPVLVLLLAHLSMSKWHCFEQHFIPCPLLSCSGLSAPIWNMFEKMSVSLLLSYLGIALIKLFGELLPGLLVFGLLQQVPEMLDLPLQQRLQVGLCLLQLHQDLIVGVVLHLFLLWLQDPWQIQQRCSSCFIPFKVLLGSLLQNLLCKTSVQELETQVPNSIKSHGLWAP